MMKRTWVYLAVAAVLILLVVVVARWRRGDSGVPEINLVEQFPAAVKATSLPSLQLAFAVEDVTINGESKRAIFAHVNSRITWTIDVPRNGAVRTAIALKPDVWTKEGDGVLFRIGVSDGRIYDEYFKQLVNPFGNAHDRRWVPVTVDLSQYEGQRVDLIFNTDAGPAGNAAYDASVWGAPQVIRQ